MDALRKHANTIAVAAITAFVVAAGPAVASTIVDTAKNALHLGGKPPGFYLPKTGTAARAKALTPLHWTNLTPINGWTVWGTTTAFGPAPAVTKDHEGFVHLDGVLDGSSQTSGVAFVLPPAFRPPNGTWVPAGDSNGSFNPQGVNIYIATDGSAEVLPMPGSNGDFVSLDGIEFYRG